MRFVLAAILATSLGVLSALASPASVSAQPCSTSSFSVLPANFGYAMGVGITSGIYLAHIAILVGAQIDQAGGPGLLRKPWAIAETVIGGLQLLAATPPLLFIGLYPPEELCAVAIWSITTSLVGIVSGLWFIAHGILALSQQPPSHGEQEEPSVAFGVAPLEGGAQLLAEGSF